MLMRILQKFFSKKFILLYAVFFVMIRSAAWGNECVAYNNRFAVQQGDLDFKTFTPVMNRCSIDLTQSKNLKLKNEYRQQFVSLRKISFKHKMWHWVVNEQSLNTYLVSDSCLSACTGFSVESASSSNYVKALLQTHQSPSPTANAGLQKSLLPTNNIFLTADLCPSSKPLDTELFNKIDAAILKSGIKTRAPVEIAFAISGLWIKNHHEELLKLLDLEKQKKIEITWVNHSYSHPYKKGVPEEKNFLLTPGIVFEDEVMNNEKIMLSQGLIPSVFFRFPGLISQDHLLNQLKKWGLIPLGSNAWVGKNQPIKPGSIILIHANGNEPKGLEQLYKALEFNPLFVQQMAELNTSVHDD